MNPHWARLFSVLVLCFFMSSALSAESSGTNAEPGISGPDTPPNILVLLVDDLGYTDLGYTGSEIRTPNIDRLAETGVFLSNFYASATCSPTRAALLTGVDPHTAGFGTMASARDDPRLGSPGFEGQLNDRVQTIARRLQDAGYHTSMSGKWHLGSGSGERPESHGFERSFALMGGGASHFADAAGLVIFERKAEYREDGEPVSLPADFYSSTFYTDRALDYIREALKQNKPFFSYVAYTAPHWPLHVPDEDRNRYAGQYDQGYGVLLKTRVAGMQARGLLPDEVTIPASPAHVPRWDSLSREQRASESRKMEIYAAMIDRLDVEIGRLLAGLEEMGALKNTLIVLMSDNGPEGNEIGRLPLNRFWIPFSFDNSPGNIGRRGSYTWTGPGWALASSGPFSLYKAFATEGGIRVPAMVSWPAYISGGRRLEGLVTVTDISATLLDYAQAAHRNPSHTAPLEGKSIRACLERHCSETPRNEYAFELFGRRSIRQGNWKALWLYPPFGTGAWQLFNLAIDPGETNDLAPEQPARLQALTSAWETWRRRTGFDLPPEEIAYGLPPRD